MTACGKRTENSCVREGFTKEKHIQSPEAQIIIAEFRVDKEGCKGGASKHGSQKEKANSTKWAVLSLSLEQRREGQMEVKTHLFMERCIKTSSNPLASIISAK